MKKTILILLAGFALLFAGCASLTAPPSDSGSVAAKIQNILGNILPPDFSGDFHINEHTPWFTITGTAKNIRKNAQGKWTWDAFVYDRSDMLNTGAHIDLTPASVPPAPPPAAAAPAP